MRSFLIGVAALAGLAADVAPASAAWDNVYQPTLFGRHRRTTTTSGCCPAPVVAMAAPVVAHSAPCPTPCQPQCTTTYVQRCYYQPVTTMETKTVLEPVTTMRTSYYYEQVTTYRYSCYYDPCTCSYQQVATPVCSLELRSKCCPVQSWVSRCVQVPKTTMVQSFYLEPHTTCCQTTVGAPILAPGAAAPVMPPPTVTPGTMPPATGAPPVINGGGGTAPGTPPSIGESRSGGTPPSIYDRYYPPGKESGTSFKPSGTVAPPPPVKLDRIALGSDGPVEGQVVRSDNSPKANAKVLFVNTISGTREYVTANTAGRFNANLPAGSWLVYLHAADDTPLFYTRINVTEGATAIPVKLVSR